MTWALLVNCLFSLSIVGFLFSAWIATCVSRTNKVWEAITDDLVTLTRSSMLEHEKVHMLFCELRAVTPQAYCTRIIFFRNPTRLFGPGIQALLQRGPLCGALHNERWWNIYEKIYMVAQPYERERIRSLIASSYPRIDLETAVVSLHFDVEAVLDPDKASIKQAMMAACEEYDDAMAAQEIMHG